MKRLPIIPTLIVAAAVAVMIGLGVWQLQRSEWKERMLAELARAPDLPPLDLDTARSGDPVAFRRASVTCRIREARAELRAGRNLRGETGYSYFIPCSPGAPGLPGQVRINAGWSQRPNSDLRLNAQGRIAGRIGTAEPSAPLLLTADEPIGPLEASAPVRVENIANNHLAYAGQWFFFAASATAIYALALRRRSKA